MKKENNEIWDTISYIKYGQIFNMPQNTFNRNYPDKKVLYYKAVRRGKLENVFNIDIKSLSPLIFKSEITITNSQVNNNIPTNKDEIVIKNLKVKNLPTTTKKENVKDILLKMNGKDDFQKLNNLLNNLDNLLDDDEISDEDFRRQISLIEKKQLLNCMKFLNYTAFGEIKTYKYLESFRKFALDYKKSYFGTDNIENHQILEKKTKDTATFTREFTEIKKFPS